jgi:hypothetical protein
VVARSFGCSEPQEDFGTPQPRVDLLGAAGKRIGLGGGEGGGAADGVEPSLQAERDGGFQVLPERAP